MNKDFKHNLYEILFGIAMGLICVCIKFFIEGIKRTNVLMISLSIVIAILMILLIVFIILTRPYKSRKKKKTKKDKNIKAKDSTEEMK